MKALTIGSAMVDIIVLVESRDVERMTMHNATSSFLLLEQGRKIEAESISLHIGGGAVNAAVAMRRLGAGVAALVKTGRDPNGERILERLDDEGIERRGVRQTDALPTGTAVMVSSHDRNATIFTQRGTNTLLTEEDLDPALFQGRDLVYATYLSNRSADCFPRIVDLARAAGAFVAANPGARQLASRAAALWETMPKLDLLALNRREAEVLVPALVAGDRPARRLGPAQTGGDDPPPRLLEMGLTSGGFDMDLPDFLCRLLEQGRPGRVLITDGTHGAYLADRETVTYCPAPKVEVMGTAGAGDAFIATTSLMLAEGMGPAEALQHAAVNAAAVVGEIDTQSGLLTRERLADGVAKAGQALAVSVWPWT